MRLIPTRYTTHDRSRSEQGGHGATDGTTNTVEGVDVERFVHSDDKLESSGQVRSDGSDGTDTDQGEGTLCKSRRSEQNTT